MVDQAEKDADKVLRESAEKATPGPWKPIEEHDEYGNGLDAVVARNGRVVFGAPQYDMGSVWDEDRAYIAAASPDRVLALLEEKASLQAEVERLRGLLADAETRVLAVALGAVASTLRESGQ